MGRDGPHPGAGGRRPLLTFRLDRQRLHRLRARLAVDGTTMSRVIVLGLRLYVQQGLTLTAGEPTDRCPEVAYPGATVDAAADHGTGDGRTRGLDGVRDGPAALEDRPATAALPSPGTAVASPAQLRLPDHLVTRLREMRESGRSDLLSATLARLHEVGWPLRPLAEALGITRQAVQARIRQPVPAEVRRQVPDCPPPLAYPRRRPAGSGRRPHLTVRIDHGLRAAAHHRAGREGRSLSQVIERILDEYVGHGLPAGGVEFGDTTPTRPVPSRRRTGRRDGGPDR